jgi:hypothetical protein
LDTSLEGRARYLNFSTPGIILGFEISDKEKATRVQGEGGQVLKESKKKKKRKKITRSYEQTSGDVVSKLRSNGRLSKQLDFIVML